MKKNHHTFTLKEAYNTEVIFKDTQLQILDRLHITEY